MKDLIRYPLEIDPQTHKKIRVAAALAEMSIKDFILTSVNKEIERRADK